MEHDPGMVKYYQEELRNCMYNLADEELIALFTLRIIEADRMRLCLRTIEDNENQEDEG
jgi:hypothetical protein